MLNASSALFNPPNKPKRRYVYAHFIDQGTEAQKCKDNAQGHAATMCCGAKIGPIFCLMLTLVLSPLHHEPSQ